MAHEVEVLSTRGRIARGLLSTYALLNRMISSPGAISTALSLAVCTALQHGILWYNPLGLRLVVQRRCLDFRCP